MIAVAAIAVAGCKENEAEEPVLSISENAIGFEGPAGTFTHTIHVTQYPAPYHHYEAVNVPPYAATNNVWAIGPLTWSDVIQVPNCNKEMFEYSTNPQCCSKTYKGQTYYYYNWYYVKQHAKMLCPAPWRWPTFDDVYGRFFLWRELPTSWSRGRSSDYINDFEGMYWLDAAPPPSNYIIETYLYSSVGHGASWGWSYHDRGLQLRCVR